MSPEIQQFLNEIAKQGTSILPFAKYAAAAVLAFYAFVGVMFVLITGTVLYQFWKMSRKF